jgi:NADP-dependent 3-hydroxy acid dehydrogenase YdfG
MIAQKSGHIINVSSVAGQPQLAIRTLSQR